MISTDSRDWASATFAGHRHRIVLAATGPHLAAWLAFLPEAEWRLPGHIVIDLAVDDVMASDDEHHITCPR